MRWKWAGLIAASMALSATAAAQDEAVDPEAEAAPEAEAESSEDEETGRIHFEAARAHFEAGRYEDALDEFLRAYELTERSQLLYNIGITQERLGHYTEAADALERFNQSHAEPDANLEERVTNLRRRAEERAREDAEVVEAPVADPAPAPPGDTAGGGVPMGAIVSYAVAGVGLATFGVFGALALAEDSSLAGECGADVGMTCDSDAVSTLQAFTIVADIGLGVAALGAVVGTVLLIVGSGSGDDGTDVAFAPMLGPDSAGLSAAGRF